MSFEFQKIEVSKLPEVVRYKWGDALLSEGFIPFPKRLLRVLSKLFDEDFSLLQVVLAVADYDRPNLRQMPSVAYLAHLAGMNEEEFMEAVGKLVSKGLVNTSGDNDSMQIILGKLKERANLIAINPTS
jgi:hypothetical protein